MSDEVLAVKYSPNEKFLAVSLLDSTVKVFYQDSLKYFLSLYGHKVSGLSGLRCNFFLTNSSASGSFYGHLRRFEINCDLFR